MRKFIIFATIAASTLVAAVPAAAQYYPPQAQGNAYGHYGNYGHLRSLQARLDQLQRHISRLDSRNILSEREANRLRAESREVERRLHSEARNGLSQREGYEIERRIQRLEVRIQREARDGNNYNRYNAGWSDRDRDGRDDRYENDRGRDHDD